VAYDAQVRSALDLKDAGVDQGWIPAKEIVSKLVEVPCRHVLILADCCFAGHLLFNYRGIGCSMYPEYARLAIRKKSREILTPCGMTAVSTTSASDGVSGFIQSIAHMLEINGTHSILSSREI
jgi:hypothetical protein